MDCGLRAADCRLRLVWVGSFHVYAYTIAYTLGHWRLVPLVEEKTVVRIELTKIAAALGCNDDQIDGLQV